MRVESDISAGQLHSVAPFLASKCFGGGKQFRANTATAKVASNVHALELATPTASVLKVLEDEDLTDAHHFAIHFGYQNVTATSTGLFNGRPVRAYVRLVLYLRR